MANSPILAIPQVAPNQAQKETTINDGFSILERSLNDVKSIDMSAGSIEVNAIDYCRFMLLKVTGVAAPGRTLTVPASKRFFMVYNAGTSAFTVVPKGTAGLAPSIPPSSYVTLFNTGIDIIKISDSATSGGVIDLLSLPDTPNDYSGQKGLALVVKPTEDGMTFGTIAVSFKQLTDGFDYTSLGGKAIRIKADASGLESYTPAAPGATNFLGLTDTPTSYAGKGHKIATVKADESGLDFLDPPDPIVKSTKAVTLVNGDFETGDLTGWTVDSGANWHVASAYSGLGPNTGAKFLVAYGPDTADQKLSQIVNLLAVTDAITLDDDAEFILTPHTQTLATVADTCSFEITPLDGSDIAIGSPFVFGPYSNSGGWVERSMRGTLPVGTRHLRVRIKAQDVDGAGVVFAFDDISLQLKVTSSFVTKFSDLTDVSPYTGNAGRVVVANDTETGLTFKDFPSSVVAVKVISAATYTLQMDDFGKYLRFTSASPVTVTVPPNVFSVGMQVALRQAGLGKLSVAEGAGVTVTTPETLNARKQHGLIHLTAVTGVLFDLTGDLELVS